MRYRLEAPQALANKDRRAKYRFGKTLGAGTYGIVREADCASGKVAVKIILKKNVKGNEQMVYDELEMLQKMKHKHIVRFVDWFESRVCTGRQQVMALLTSSGRTNTTLSPNSQPVESSLIVFANRASSRRKTPLKPFAKFSRLWTISTITMSFTEVSSQHI
jgi:serine/threonine protein kinase